MSDRIQQLENQLVLTQQNIDAAQQKWATKEAAYIAERDLLQTQVQQLTQQLNNADIVPYAQLDNLINIAGIAASDIGASAQP